MLGPSGAVGGGGGESAPPRLCRASSAAARGRGGSLIVDVAFKPSRHDKRRIDVKFDKCRLQGSRTPLDITFPLGIFGPAGWLRIGYYTDDDNMKIPRGHKGSVFILTRTAKRKE